MTVTTAIAAAPAEDVEEGRRARKKRATRQALCQAAVELALEHGLDGVTVDQLADAADVSPRTFFNYFASKEEAITNPDPDLAARFLARLLARPPEETPLLALRETCVAMAAEMSASPKQFRARLELIEQEPALLVASMARWHAVAQGLSEVVAGRCGLRAEDAYPVVVVAAVVAAVRTAMLRWAHGWDDRPVTEQVGEAVDLLADGLPAPPR